MRNSVILVSFPFLLITALFFLGPAPDKPSWRLTMPSVPNEVEALEQYIAKNESKHTLRPDNQARIVWHNSAKEKTHYSVIYLHGFSASQKEGDPIHRNFAEAFGCNLYLARLSDHGLDTTEALVNFTTDRWWESAKEALAIGNVIGEKVIIVSTSTGSTMALALAAAFPEKVHALINLSPNIAINNEAAFLLNGPWGLQIARAVMGSNYREGSFSAERRQYWDQKYRLEAAVQLQEMLESKMTSETFEKIRQPSLTLYYYKNEEEQDTEVKVSAMLAMHEQLSTPDSLKRIKAIPNAGAHVIGCSLVSKDIESVYQEMFSFAKEVVGMEETLLKNQ